jgi:hypothetical protein
VGGRDCKKASLSLSLSLMSIDDANKKKKLKRCFIAMRLGLLRAIFILSTVLKTRNTMETNAASSKL